MLCGLMLPEDVRGRPLYPAQQTPARGPIRGHSARRGRETALAIVRHMSPSGFPAASLRQPARSLTRHASDEPSERCVLFLDDALGVPPHRSRPNSSAVRALFRVSLL